MKNRNLHKTLVAAPTLVALALLATGCLVGKVSHTFYLDPDGSVTWSVLEQEMHSDIDDPVKRQKEEDDYIGAARNGEHPMARALAVLHPTELETVEMRTVRPFSIMTSGRFESLSELALSTMYHAGIEGKSWIERNGPSLRFVLILAVEQEMDDSEGELLAPLVAEVEDYRIRLTTGRFTEAVGFSLEEDGTVAVLLEREEEEAANGEFFFSLTWNASL